jgi:predicted permease
MQALWQDLRYGVRLLRGTPGFTVVAVLTIALGIAVNTTVFSWVNAVLLNPVPGTRNPSQLHYIETFSRGRTPSANMSWRDYQDYRDQLRHVEGVAVGKHTIFSVGPEGRPQRVWGELVSGNYFSLLQVNMLKGRGFSPEEGATRAVPVALISERLWRRLFKGQEDVLGRSIRVNRHELTVIGVAPEAFHGGTPGVLYDLWIPFPMGPVLGIGGSLTYRPTRDITATFVRLRAGGSVEQVNQEVGAVADRLARDYPATNGALHATVLPLAEGHNGAQGILGRPLRVLFAVGALVLLIACANVANLLLAKTVTRAHEFGIRLALGSGRGRLVRQVLSETLLLAAAGTLCGILMALWLRDSLDAILPAHDMPISLATSLDGRTLAFTIGLCFLATTISGTLPALFSSQYRLSAQLKEGGRTDTGSRKAHRLRDLLIVCEMALACVALIGAALFVRSFRNASGIDPGFEARGVLLSHFYLSPAGYNASREIAFCRLLRDRVRSVPAVQAVAYADQSPMDLGAHPWHQLTIEGYLPSPGEDMYIQRTLVSSGYFDLLRIPILEGRDFTDLDTRQTPRVIVVNETFAKRYFAGASPLGRRVRFEGIDHTVVGLVRDARYHRPMEAPIPYFYAKYDQFFSTGLPTKLYIRTEGDPVALVPALRKETAAIDPNVATFHALPLTEQISGGLFAEKAAASLLSGLGALALFLAAIGLYGVMSYSVSQRTQELGIRLALGAEPRRIVASVIGGGLLLAGLGVAAGLALTTLLTRSVEGMLVHVSASEPLVYAAAAAFLLAIAVLACGVPAYRAIRVEPITALRSE